MNFNNFTIKSQEAIQKAVEITRGAGTQAIEPVCLLKGVIDEGESVLKFIFQKIGANPAVVIRQVDMEIAIDNVYTPRWWEKEPQIKTWRLNQRYLIEIRANEFTYHPPHFHVTSNEYSAVFGLNDGALYRDGKNKWPPDMVKEIAKWYKIHRKELLEAWVNLHGD